ncbi:uncharacterized protein LACBIDRAFT_294894 [Laccaria bicolor S238N-H82]|uniref:Predicted protein n=1 Tax=Laccaria bicolor (strain S238N-H82 / ATCC MYA-4686) TaxID=486041 RepID=B0DK14_LACBS|nr:uncharacterized protein LACBIDRAFT_294894 [Laccaria bicolor S238N-H82]EDR04861.1 predicted protein [Laccaria bicolor S238N-H82]|eukprot:XP_001884251.1 predicted protein [Laccaria bicolor S238N-H82]
MSLPLPPSLLTTSCLSAVSSSTPTPNAYDWKSLEGVEHCQQQHHTNQPRTRTCCHVDTLLTNPGIMVNVPSPVTSGSLAWGLLPSLFHLSKPCRNYFTPHVTNYSLSRHLHHQSTKGAHGREYHDSREGSHWGFDFELVASIRHTGDNVEKYSGHAACSRLLPHLAQIVVYKQQL